MGHDQKQYVLSQVPSRRYIINKPLLFTSHIESWVNFSLLIEQDAKLFYYFKTLYTHNMMMSQFYGLDCRDGDSLTEKATKIALIGLNSRDSTGHNLIATEC